MPSIALDTTLHSSSTLAIHQLKAEQQKKGNALLYISFLWYHQESNQGHTDFQSVALPTELWYRLGAEATRFELVVRLPVRQFSKLLVSATHPHFLEAL